MLPVDPSSAAAQVLAAAAGGVKPGFQATIGDVWGGLIGDRVHYWRQRNLVDLLEKTANYMRQKGINLGDAKALPEGELYAIFEGASKADTPNLQELWATLTANRMTAGAKSPFFNTIAATLQRMSEIDARLIRFIHREGQGFSRASMSAYDVMRQQSQSFIRGDKTTWMEAHVKAQEEAKTIRITFINAVEQKLKIDELEDAAVRDIAKCNLINLGILIRDIGDPPRTSRPPGDRGLDGNFPSDAIDHLSAEIEELSDWMSSARDSRLEALWTLSEHRVLMHFEISDLGRHLLGEVGAQIP